MRVIRKGRDILRSWNTRGKYIMGDVNRSCEYGKVNLNYFRLEGDMQNVGDVIAIPILRWILELYNLKDVALCKYRGIHLYTVGSILFSGFQDAVIWGSGCLFESYNWMYRMIYRHIKLDIRAVRGPETERILNDIYHKTEKFIYGDPGVLLPLIYKPQIQPIYDYAFIYHYSNQIPHLQLSGKGEVISTLTSDWHSFVDKLLAAKLVISNSLHGIILAEAYGIPAIMVKDSRAEFNMFKYRDWYYSTERYDFPVAETFEQALTMKPCKLPDLESMRENLLNSFPKDLFEKQR